MSINSEPSETHNFAYYTKKILEHRANNPNEPNEPDPYMTIAYDHIMTFNDMLTYVFSLYPSNINSDIHKHNLLSLIKTFDNAKTFMSLYPLSEYELFSYIKIIRQLDAIDSLMFVSRYNKFKLHPNTFEVIRDKPMDIINHTLFYDTYRQSGIDAFDIYHAIVKKANLTESITFIETYPEFKNKVYDTMLKKGSEKQYRVTSANILKHSVERFNFFKGMILLYDKIRNSTDICHLHKKTFMYCISRKTRTSFNLNTIQFLKDNPDHRQCLYKILEMEFMSGRIDATDFYSLYPEHKNTCHLL